MKSNELTIYRQQSDGTAKAVFTTPINKDSKRSRTLMGDDYITLKFSVAEPIYFHLGDYVDYYATDEQEYPERFEVVDFQKPDYNESTGGYDYELRLDAEYMKWQNKKFMYRPEYGGREASWTLTAFPSTFGEIFLANLTAHGYCYRRDPKSPYAFVLDDGTDFSEMKNITFDNVNMIDALTSIAEAWDCEWWVEAQEIHLGKCENGTEEDAPSFEDGVTVTKMSASDSSAEFASRLYVFGGTTNIPERYRKSLVFDVKEIGGRNGLVAIRDTARDLTIGMFKGAVEEEAYNKANVLPFTQNTQLYAGALEDIEFGITDYISLTPGTYKFDFSQYSVSVCARVGKTDVNTHLKVAGRIKKSNGDGTSTVVKTGPAKSVEGGSGFIDNEEPKKLTAGGLPNVELEVTESAGYKVCIVVTAYTDSETINNAPYGVFVIDWSVRTMITKPVAHAYLTFFTGGNKGKTLPVTFSHASEGFLFDDAHSTATVGDTFVVSGEIATKTVKTTEWGEWQDNAAGITVGEYGLQAKWTVQYADNTALTRTEALLSQSYASCKVSEAVALFIATSAPNDRPTFADDGWTATLMQPTEEKPCVWMTIVARLSDGREVYGSRPCISEAEAIDGATVKYRTSVTEYTEEPIGNQAFLIRAKVPAKYFTSDYESDIVKNAVVETHLMLPESWNDGHNWIDAEDDLSEEEIVEGIVVFDDIYPKTECTVTSVDWYETEDKDEDGNKVGSWTRYFLVNDENLTLDKDWILSTVTNFSILFTGGNLSGMEFEMNLWKEGDKTDGNVRKSDGTIGVYKAAGQLFHIIANEDYGLQLPDETFYPQVGDTFVLRGYDADFFEDMGLVEKAEAELLEKGKEYMEKSKVDGSTYTCPLYWWAAQKFGELQLGRRVRLRNRSFFKDGERLSRIIGYERCLDYSIDTPQYTVGESAQYSRLGDIEDKLDAISAYGKTYTQAGGEGGASIYIIKSGASAVPTDNNVYSAKRSDQQYLRKDTEDAAAELITFDKGLTANDTINAKDIVAEKVTADTAIIEDAQIGEATITEATIGEADVSTMTGETTHNKLESFAIGMTSAKDMLPYFDAGFTGYGWRMLFYDGLSSLELDSLTVRQRMRVFELLIEKVRSVGGQIVVSAANGKVKSVENTGDYYKLTFETENTFAAGDLARCQSFKGFDGEGDLGLKSYWVEVYAADGNSILIPVSEFDDYGCEPEEGDELVLMGNTTDTTRQNLILIAATDDGQPRISIYNGVSTKNFTDDNLRCRVGNLDGIEDGWFTGDNKPHGDGLYADNAYLKGTFLLETGEDVKTRLEVVEGKISSEVEALRKDLEEDGGILSNNSFTDGLSKWSFANSNAMLASGGKFLWANGNVLSDGGAYVSVINDDGRNVLHLDGTYIRQDNANMRDIPPCDMGTGGMLQAYTVYVTIVCKVEVAGAMSVRFASVDKSGYSSFTAFSVSARLAVTEDYEQLTYSGLWNGTGNFMLAFSGVVSIRSILLTTDKAMSVAVRYKTLFEQSAKLLKLAAANFDANGNVLQSSELMVKPDSAGIMTKDENGKIASIGTYVDGVVKLTGDQIQLEGTVTANGNVTIRTDGAIQARQFYADPTDINVDVDLVGYFEGLLHTPTSSGDHTDAYRIFLSKNGKERNVFPCYTYKVDDHLLLNATFTNANTSDTAQADMEGYINDIFNADGIKDTAVSPKTTTHASTPGLMLQVPLPSEERHGVQIDAQIIVTGMDTSGGNTGCPFCWIGFEVSEDEIAGTTNKVAYPVFVGQVTPSGSGGARPWFAAEIAGITSSFEADAYLIRTTLHCVQKSSDKADGYQWLAAKPDVQALGTSDYN